MSDGTCYLPDFWLPDLELWVEVKGRMTTEDRHKIERFRDDHAKESAGDYAAWRRGALWVVGNLPDEKTLQDPCYPYNITCEEEIWSIDWDWPYIPCVCPICGKPGIEFDGRGARVCGDGCPCGDKGYTGNDVKVLEAYRAARRARFEHGETPTRRTNDETDSF